MIDIDKKLEKIEKNCIEAAKKENQAYKTENDVICDKTVNEKINNYKDELAKKYRNELQKFDRELNRNLFDYEMEQRTKITQFKQNLVNNIKAKIVEELWKFVDSFEYKEFLFKNIDSTLKRLDSKEKIELYITEKDFNRFKDEISYNYGIFPIAISDENIGGCSVKDNINKIYIDNTIRTNIEEKIKEV